jgi:gamma-glutamylcyclotransferase (GGCT)/AIG2-like uncharacterized protein YtfP
VSDYLFVYGSLRSTFDNPYAKLLHANSDFLGSATVTGTVAKIDGFPAFVPGGAGVVTGELYRMRNPAQTLHVLDEYEGSAYERVLVDASGRTAWIFQAR